MSTVLYLLNITVGLVPVVFNNGCLHSSTDTPMTIPTNSPTYVPTNVPTNSPTYVPTNSPTYVPTNVPTNSPTHVPTNSPTYVPTNVPTNSPTDAPTNSPTYVPTNVPTNSPTDAPTNSPTYVPTDVPTNIPIDVDAQLLFDTVGYLKDHHKSAFNNMITRLKTDNLWSKRKYAHLFIPSADEQFSLRNVFSPLSPNQAFPASFGIPLISEAQFDHPLRNNHVINLPMVPYLDIDASSGITIIEQLNSNTDDGWQWGSYAPGSSKFMVQYNEMGEQIELTAYKQDRSVLASPSTTDKKGHIYSFGINLENDRRQIYEDGTLLSSVENGMGGVPPNYSISWGALSDGSSTAYNYHSKYISGGILMFEELLQDDLQNAINIFAQFQHDMRRPCALNANSDPIRNIVCQGNSITEFYNSQVYRNMMINRPHEYETYRYIGLSGRTIGEIESSVNDPGLENDSFVPEIPENWIVNLEIVNELTNVWNADDYESVGVPIILSLIESWVSKVKGIGYSNVFTSTCLASVNLVNSSDSLNWYKAIDMINNALINETTEKYGNIINLNSAEFFVSRSQFQSDEEFETANTGIISNTEWYRNDKLHLSRSGCELAGQRMAAVMNLY